MGTDGFKVWGDVAPGSGRAWEGDITIPGAMLAGVDVPSRVFFAAIAVGLVWFSAQIPRALKTAREVTPGQPDPATPPLHAE